MLDVRKLRLLRELAHRATIAAVADALAYTPSAVSQQLAALELMVTELDPAAVPDALRTGALDVALVHEYDYVPTEPDPALDTEPLIEEAIYLASAGAAEPGEDPVRRHRDSPWIMASPGTLCHTMAVRACEAAGFTPRVRHHADDFA